MRFAACLVLMGVAAGCAPAATRGPQQPKPADTGPVTPIEVSEQAFGRSAYQVLLSGDRTSERSGLLVGVVRRQLARAAARFAQGHPSRGLAALTGALYLCRTGELRPEMLTNATAALRPAAEEVARRGNEGRAAALYGMLRELLPGGKERADVEAHLAELARWSQATRGSGPMRAAGSEQRVAVDRALFDPSASALEAARRSTLAWLSKALAYDIESVPLRTPSERDEAIEAYRAIRAGGATLVALYLRNGDAGGALGIIDRPDVGRVIPPGLRELIERISDDADPDAWADLLRLFDAAETPERPETALDAELARAAVWGSALALFRAEPNGTRGALPLARLLVRYDMAEAAAAVLGSALAAEATPRDTSEAIRIVLQTIIDLDEIGDLAGAQRTFAAAGPILEIAESRPLRAAVRPSAARARFVMAAIETRSGEIATAREHAVAAARDEPSFDALMLLGRIAQQRAAKADALNAFATAAAAAKKATDAAAETEALLAAAEVHRDSGDAAGYRRALHAALLRALDARQLARTAAEQARAERLLGRALEQHGDVVGARRASERAYESVGSDVAQLTATLLDAARRAVTRRDLASGRDALRRAVDTEIDDDDLVYVMLWTLLVEKKLGVPADGNVAEALAALQDASGWSAKLAAWAQGRLDDAALLSAARTKVERTEASFYVAMAQDARGDASGALARLREVASSETIELVEVAVARDLVASQNVSPPRLPEGVSLP